MIGMLRGRIVSISAADVLIDVNGVGYRVAVPPRAVGHLPPVGEEAVLHTHLHVREDVLALYGFPTLAEREVFEALLPVNGVGPKLALTILSVLAPDDLRRAVATNDRDAICLVPGIGPKTATRLLLEMRDRIGVPADIAAGEPRRGGDGTAPSAVAELRGALEGLGYSPDEVRAAIGALGDPAGRAVPELLRSALRSLGPR